jgi:hypothetical protein
MEQMRWADSLDRCNAGCDVEEINTVPRHVLLGTLRTRSRRYRMDFEPAGNQAWKTVPADEPGGTGDQDSSGFSHHVGNRDS